MHDIPLSLDTVDAASGRTGAPGAQRMEEIMSGMRIQFSRAPAIPITPACHNGDRTRYKIEPQCVLICRRAW